MKISLVFPIFNVLSTPIEVSTMVVLTLAVWTFFVHTFKIVKKFCVALYIVADKNKLILKGMCTMISTF